MRIQELGHVVLYVTNLERSAQFYRDTLGFSEIFHNAHMALFSGGRTHHELLLIEIGGEAPARKAPTPGLYHIGFKVGDDSETLRNAYKELKEKGVHILGSGDHTITHSLYLLDPDGNELELYVDVSQAWRTNPQEILRPTKILDLE